MDSTSKLEKEEIDEEIKKLDARFFLPTEQGGALSYGVPAHSRHPPAGGVSVFDPVACPPSQMEDGHLQARHL